MQAIFFVPYLLIGNFCGIFNGADILWGFPAQMATPIAALDSDLSILSLFKGLSPFQQMISVKLFCKMPKKGYPAPKDFPATKKPTVPS